MDALYQRLIAELNKDVEWEYAAAIQYIHHATVMSGAQFESFRKELLIHSQEEIQHAQVLSEQISFLGGVPTVGVEQRMVSDNSLEMLRQDLESEVNAIARYKERIAQAEELQEYALRRILEDILLQEEEHKRDLVSALDTKYL